MIAISRIGDQYSIGDTVSNKSGYYTKDGVFLSGDQLLSQDEAAYRIWRQTQSPKFPESELRKKWSSIKSQ